MMQREYITPAGEYPALFMDMLNQHLLIAGAQGSGKSVLIDGLMYTALFNSPAKAKFILIDPKGTELETYHKLPHVIEYADDSDGTQQQIVSALRRAIDIMGRRYHDMKRRRLRVYDGSTVYVIIDELADLMTTNKRVIMPLLQRLAQKGRASAITLIAATQCPLAAILPTPIKCNFSARVGLKTATRQDSRNIIDIAGCEALPDPRKDHIAMGYYRRGALTDCYNIPMIPTDKIEWIVKYWTGKQGRGRLILFGR